LELFEDLIMIKLSASFANYKTPRTSIARQIFVFSAFMFLFLFANISSAGAQGTGVVSGELMKWHKTTISFDGPSTSEYASPNPFLNYRLNVTFTKDAKTYVVPGYYAADGNAAETGGNSGSTWRVHFVPDEAGVWNYTASFRRGNDVAISADPNAGTPTSFDGATGGFTVGATDKTGRDHRGKGMLRYVGKHHLQFAETGEYFLKGGADSPENFLAYNEFDQTPASHYYNPHADDWQTGDTTWRGSEGKNIIGALNYLSGKGMNSVYFLTMNVTGDGNDVWPWISSSDRDRFDTSKLDQWELVFSHMDKVGLMLHVVTQEIENCTLLDGGELGAHRKLYYRELISRFGHHLALQWNLGEENRNTDNQRKDFAAYIRSIDPYQHPIVVHTWPGETDAIYNPLLGYPYFEGPSIQVYNMNETHAETIKWIDRSASNNRKWHVSLDEIGPADVGVLPDAYDYWHDQVRKQALWGNLMAGGAGVEWYFGYAYPHHDLNSEDWRSRDHMWDLTRYALQFFQQHIPFSEMKHADELTSNPSDYCIAKAGEVYSIYLPNGGTTNLDLGSSTATFIVQWYNPRTGGSLQNGSVTSITGSGFVSIGTPPGDTTNDWVALIRLSTNPTPSPTPLPMGQKLSGTVFGTSPPYSPDSEFDKAFDADTATFFDYSQPSGGYTGLDLGTSRRIISLRYFPRASYASRMAGGKFQGSNTSATAGYVDLHTVSDTPAAGTFTQVTITDTNSYRWVRYLSPVNGYGNVAEVEFYGDVSQPTPGGLPSPWVSSDLGSVALPGSATHSSGTFTVTAAGSDIWGTADSFHYVYQPLSGNGEIVARVTSVQNTHPNAKAGVMIRETLSATSPHAMMNITPSVGGEFLEFLRRYSGGGETSFSGGGSMALPYWVKLVRNGSTVSGYSSSDGTSWVLVRSETIQMEASVYIGLAVTSHNNSVLTTATFDNVAVSAVTTPLPISGTGLKGEYFDNQDFTNLKVTRTDSTVNFDWGTAAPDSSMDGDSFSIRWTGQVQPQYSQTYTFYTQSNDGVRLWVNGVQLINNWTEHTSTEDSGTITLVAGQKYDIQMEFFEGQLTALTRLSWSSASQAKQVIPQQRLY
jgi:hypothetical protein